MALRAGAAGGRGRVRARLVAGPDQVRHGDGRRVGDTPLQLPQVVGHGDGLLAASQPSDRLDLQREPAGRRVGAEDED
jgi:hypothetical protein